MTSTVPVPPPQEGLAYYHQIGDDKLIIADFIEGKGHVGSVGVEQGNLEHLLQQRLSGRGIFTRAARSLTAGQVVFNEEPLVLLVNDNALRSLCAACARPLTPPDTSEPSNASGVLPRTCSGCTRVSYCSPQCEDGHSEQHREGVECDLMKSLGGDESLMPRLLLYGLLKQDPAIKRQLALLMGHAATLSDREREQLQVQMGIIMGMNTTKGATDGCTSSTLLALANAEALWASAQTNCVALLSPIDHSCAGVALCLQVSLLNHSCIPNCCVINDGRRFTVRAITDIQEDEELTISYIDVAQTTPQRQCELQQKYNFTCACPRCDPAHPDDVVAKPIRLVSPAFAKSIHGYLAEQEYSKLLQGHQEGGNGHMALQTLLHKHRHALTPYALALFQHWQECHDGTGYMCSAMP